MIEKIAARSRLYFPNTSVSVSKAFDFFMQLENRVERRSRIRKSYAAAKWMFLEEMKDLGTTGLFCLLMTSHCTSKMYNTGKGLILIRELCTCKPQHSSAHLVWS